MKISSSSLSLIVVVVLNRLPSTGMSPSQGTLVAALDWVVERMPPSTSVSPSPSSTWVWMARVSMAGTFTPPEATMV